jgi:hypothetical protein
MSADEIEPSFTCFPVISRAAPALPALARTTAAIATSTDGEGRRSLTGAT